MLLMATMKAIAAKIGLDDATGCQMVLCGTVATINFFDNLGIRHLQQLPQLNFSSDLKDKTCAVPPTIKGVGTSNEE